MMEVVVEFDYVAQNVDEIDIKKGDRIRNVIQREEGWFEGELVTNGKIGLFPDNFVKTIKTPPPAMISKNLPHPPGLGNTNHKIKSSSGIPTMQQQQAPPPSTPVTPPPSILQSIHQQQQQKINNHNQKQQMHPKPVKPVSPNNSSERYKARVLYSYIPVNEDELAIQENEIVEVIRLVEDGWFEGTFMGRQGVFPSNYVERVSTPPTSTAQQPQAEITFPKSDLANIEKTPSYTDNNSVESDLDKSTSNNNNKKSKKVLGIGFGNIFSGKQIELKTKENFSNQKSNTLTIEHHSERHSERQIADSIMRNDPEAGYLASEATKPMRGIRAKVLYDYMPTQPDELRLIVGEFVYITDKNLEDEGWYKGECTSTGAVGVFPDNFVEEVPDIPANNKSPSLHQAFAKNKNQSSDNLAPQNQLAASSLTNSSVSNSSSNNSLSKLAPVAKTIPLSPKQPVIAEPIAPAVDPIQAVAAATEYDEMSDELDEFGQQANQQQQQQATDNKLTHIKKTKQMNKRPPSFRRKKDLPVAKTTTTTAKPTEPVSAKSVADIELESVSSKMDIMSVSTVEEAVKEAIVVKSNHLEVPGVIATSPVPQSPNMTMNRQGTNLSGAGVSSDVSMATTMTVVDATQSTLIAGSVDRLEKEIGYLREELAEARSENQGLQVELSTFRSQHDEQVKRLQLQMLDLVGEIDEEKKTRLAFQVELERMKKTIMTNL